MKTIEIDGRKIADYTSFVAEVNAKFISQLAEGDELWTGNLDAFNDYLSWPAKKSKWTIHHSEQLRRALGYPETIKWLESKRIQGPSSQARSLNEEIERAKKAIGPTLFDLVLEIFVENKDRAELILK